MTMLFSNNGLAYWIVCCEPVTVKQYGRLS